MPKSTAPKKPCHKCAVLLDDGRRRLCESCSTTHRWCSQCQNVKALDEFFQSKGEPTRWCKPCHTAHQWRPERREKNSDYHYRYHLKRKFGIDDAHVDELLAVTTCDVCGEPPKEGRRLNVDHDHATGVVRGVVCSRCNHFLAALDAEHLLEALRQYLVKKKAGVPQ